MVLGCNRASSRFVFSGVPNYSSNSSYTGKHCHLERGANDYPKNCLIRGKTSKTIYFAGNSHTDHYRETHFLLNKDLGVSIDGVTVSSCILPPASNQDGCGLVQQKQQKRVIAAIKDGDIVAVSNRYAINDESDGWMQSKLSVESLNNFAERVFEKGGRVILFGPLPEFKIEATRCTRFWFRPFLDAECETSEKRMQEARSIPIQLANLIDKRILIYNPFDAICSNGKCRLVDESNRPLFVDKDHLTDYANRKYILPSFKDFLFSNQLLSVAHLQ
jgi:hypothetical protein